MENITLAPMMVLKKDKQEAIAEAQKLLEELGLNTKGKLYPTNFRVDKSNGLPLLVH